jgi:hypothetical protein
MTPQEFDAAYPKIYDWIQKTLASCERTARTVASMQFSRLPLYFGEQFLHATKFVAVPRVPIPPLSAMGLNRFADFEHGDFAGITYLNLYFLKNHVTRIEALHCHELIHVIQWKLLGPERFLRAYADGLERYGYQNSPLEKMAYDAERLFSAGSARFDPEKFVVERLGPILTS